MFAALPDLVGTIPDAQDLNSHLGETLFGEAEFIGHGLGDVEHATANEGASVIHADFGRAAVFQVGDLDETRNGKGFVGRDACPRPEFLSSRCLARKDEKVFGVVGSDTHLGVAQGIIWLHGMVANTSNRVRFGFVAFDIRPHAGREGQAENPDGEGEKDAMKRSFHGVARGFNNCSAPIRDEGRRPQ